MLKRDLGSIADLNQNEIHEIFDLAATLKKKVKNNEEHKILKDKTLAMIFEKPSLRTRSTFQVGMYQLGGEAIYLSPQEVGMGKRESVYDVAKNLERWFNFVMARVFEHSSIEQLIVHCSLPVINGLSDHEHPCQALTDIFTLLEHKKEIKGLNLVFVGDGNNVSNSLMLLSSLVGINFTLCCPKGYESPKSVYDKSKAFAAATGSEIKMINDPYEAVRNADAIYTDVWASMGQENESEQRKKVFAPYQVNTNLVASAQAGVLIMHDLPAHRGEEITSEVIDSENSIVFDQAENRLHVQKGILVFLHKKLTETT